MEHKSSESHLMKVRCWAQLRAICAIAGRGESRLSSHTYLDSLEPVAGGQNQVYISAYWS